MSIVHVFKNGTNVRLAGLLEDNVITVVDAGAYEALHQCQGDKVVEGHNTNTWWVKIVAGSRQGWVSAVRIQEGGNDEPVPGPPKQRVEWV